MTDRIGHALFDWAISANAWTALLLVCAVVLDRALVHRAHASLRMALYAPIALRVLLPFSWSIRITQAPAAVVLPLDALSASAAPMAALVAPGHALLAVLYVAVAAALAVRMLLQRRRLARILASARLAGSMGGPYPVLRHHELGPMVVGIAAPRIVLPDALVEGSTPDALACVLRHEIAHIRRGDLWFSAAMQALLVVCWPVVPLWIAAARVRHLMELACDESALAGADPSERRRYGHVLLDVANHGMLGLAGAGSLHFGSILRARVEAIALQRPWPRAVQGALVASAVLGFAACSSAGPGTMPEPTGGTQPAAAGTGTDAYGYKYDDDPLAKMPAAQAGAPTPASTTNENGRLAPEVIQSVVRSNFGRFRTCYETALETNAKLQGRVTVGFNINPDGTVGNPKDEGSTLADANAIECIVGGFGKLAFPPPKGGYVTVVYPIEFSPGD
jgi:beta-lactamase regulating signal transducer with metallopeptidase domain